MKYPASANFDAALKVVAVLCNDETNLLSKKEKDMMFEVMGGLLRAYSAYWNRQQALAAEAIVEVAVNNGRLSEEEAKFLRKTLRNQLA